MLRINLGVAVVMIATAGAIASVRTNGSAAPSHPLRESLTTAQIDNLVLLGKVWGFAKYHHPAITTGRVDPDSALRQILPAVLKANGRSAASTTISDWLAGLGAPDACATCAAAPESTYFRADIDWIRDERALGRALSAQLQSIYRNRPTESTQHFLSFVPGVGNPVFRNEKAFAEDSLPASDLRLLALYRFWNMVEYWSPDRDLIHDNRDALLREFVPRVWNADDPDSYRLAMMALIARIQDGHANLWNALSVRPPRGRYRLPVTVRFIEGKAVVTGFTRDSLAAASGLKLGDVISSIDGTRVDSLVAAWAPYYAASNQPARLREIGKSLTQGAAGRVRIVGERNGSTFDVQPERVRIDSLDWRAGIANDLPGDAFQLLTPDVAYLKLSSVVAAQSSEYITKAAGTKVLVIDIRNYPREFVVFALGGHFVSIPTEFARFTRGTAANPGAFIWTQPVSLRPLAPLYDGKIVILVDETSQSQAEYTAMAFRSAPNALVVGSTTAGADGNISPIVLPGGLRTLISGIGVFYPDRRPTQQVGIVPDLVVRPTIAGIRQGRDEVLEAGVSRALGRQFTLPSRP